MAAIHQSGSSGPIGSGSASKIRLGVWNRLEPRPRKVDFTQALGVTTADALWMLTRQWQFGEFTGEDAASGIKAAVTAGFTPVSRISIDGQVEAFNKSLPLEAQIEAEPVPFDWRTNLQVSAYWKKLLKKAGVPQAVFQHFIHFFPMTKLLGNWDEADVQGDRKLRNQFDFLETKALDSALFIKELDLKSGNAAEVLKNHLNYPLLLTTEQSEIDTYQSSLADAGKLLQDWFNSLYCMPKITGKSAWNSSRLEYRFDLAAPDLEANRPRIALRSSEYYQGQPDWFAFERDDAVPPTNPLVKKDLMNGEQTTVETKSIELLSAITDYPGMPTARWWEFENNVINFGKIDANTSDLTTIVMAEFGFLHSKDWRVVPFNVKFGSISKIQHIVVTDSFGFNISINAPNADDWHFIGLTQQKSNGTYTADPSLFFPPLAYKTQEGRPIEHVLFARDEMANMVWAIEKTVPGFVGVGTDAYQAFLRRKSTFPTKSEIEHDATYKYQLMSDVPENWVPFIPAKIPGSQSEIRLLRGKTIKSYDLQNSTDHFVKPRGKFLTEVPFPYFIFEEEVPREGIQVYRNFRRTRWINGKVVCWLGRKKNAGRGEGSSGLVFDNITRLEKNKAST